MLTPLRFTELAIVPEPAVALSELPLSPPQLARALSTPAATSIEAARRAYGRRICIRSSSRRIGFRMSYCSPRGDSTSSAMPAR